MYLCCVSSGPHTLTSLANRLAPFPKIFLLSFISHGPCHTSLPHFRIKSTISYPSKASRAFSWITCKASCFPRTKRKYLNLIKLALVSGKCFLETSCISWTWKTGMPVYIYIFFLPGKEICKTTKQNKNKQLSLTKILS